MTASEPDGPAPRDPIATEEHSTLAAVCRSASWLMSAIPGPVRRIRVGTGEVYVDVEWPESPVAGPATVPVPVPSAGGNGAAPAIHHVRAPMVGTFYRAPAPGEEPFVREGDVVTAGQQVAILEAMKMMMPVHADCAGEVVQVLVTDGAAVEYGEALIVIAPNTA